MEEKKKKNHERRLRTLANHLLPTPSLSHSHSHSYCQANPVSSSSSSCGGVPVIVGGMVLDIHAVPFSAQIEPGTTTPGNIQYARGGVARNVAECMEKLGVNPFLISIVGQDMAGDMLLNHWQSLGLEITGIRRCENVVTPVVSVIFDGDGEQAAAVADTHAVEDKLTFEWISQFERNIKCATVLMLDANLNPSALQSVCKLANSADVPIWFEPVSVMKSVRFKGISEFITFASPNEAELLAMAGSKDSLSSLKALYGAGKTIEEVVELLKPSIVALLESGIKHVALTLGKYGAVLCTAGPREPSRSFSQKGVPRNYSNGQKLSSSQMAVSCVHFPCLPATVIRLTGAGDSFVAGALAALCNNNDIFTSVAFGIAAAKQTVQSELNVAASFPQAQIRADAELVLASAKDVLLN